MLALSRSSECVLSIQSTKRKKGEKGGAVACRGVARVERSEAKITMDRSCVVRSVSYLVTLPCEF